MSMKKNTGTVNLAAHRNSNVMKRYALSEFVSILINARKLTLMIFAKKNIQF